MKLLSWLSPVEESSADFAQKTIDRLDRWIEDLELDLDRLYGERDRTLAILRERRKKELLEKPTTSSQVALAVVLERRESE